jgi:dTDP-4-dehydrorhamnose 3,5-epimerase
LQGTLAYGVRRVPLTTHRDARGGFTEFFRAAWELGPDPVQWNVVHSARGVLRGVHVHIRHTDYLVVVSGRASVGLRDLRAGSPTEGAVALVEMSGLALTGLVIPPGVAHGFLFHEPSIHVYAVSSYWDPADELGCHWSDPALGIPWPAPPTELSARDARLPPLSALLAALPAWPAPAAGDPAPAATRDGD